MTLRILRGIVGFIAVWQIIGLLSVMTNWLTNVESTTGDMLAIAFVKFLVLLVCTAAYYWLGHRKKKHESANAQTSELPAIGVALVAVMVFGIAAAIVIPNLRKESAQQSAPTTVPGVNAGQSVALARIQEPVPSAETATRPQTIKECLDSYATPASSVSNMELLQESCASAFDPAEHPISRARSMCNVKAWTDSPQVAPIDAMQKCSDDNPKPPCPTGLSFEMHNRRCEVVCKAMDGFAPDSSGQRCIHVCPEGTMAMYAGTLRECMKLSRS